MLACLCHGAQLLLALLCRQGSVGDFLVGHLSCPVAVVRGATPAAADEGSGEGEEAGASPGPEQHGASHDAPPRRVVLAVDASEHSAAASRWYLSHLRQSRDEVHVVSVAPPVPLPVMDEMAAPALAAFGQSQWEADREQAMRTARLCCEAALRDAAGQGVPQERLWYRPLAPEGGASEVGASLVHYAKSNGADLVVVGSRGMGALRSGVMAVLGLGSVSLYVAHHLAAPVVVVKSSAEGGLAHAQASSVDA